MTTNVLVTGDTHVHAGARLPEALLLLADRADHIVHAGDIVTSDVLDTLAALAPTTAVRGNCDDASVAARLPERVEIEIDGVRIGMVHDAGPAAGRHERLSDWFPSCRVVVYGHTHAPDVSHVPGRDLLVLNAGSPTQRRRADDHTACWVQIDGGVVTSAELVVMP